MQNRGPSPGSSGYRVGARYDKGCHSALDAHRVTPHVMRSPVHDIRGIATGPSPGFSGYRVGAQHNKGCHSARDAHRVTPHSDAGSSS